MNVLGVVCTVTVDVVFELVFTFRYCLICFCFRVGVFFKVFDWYMAASEGKHEVEHQVNNYSAHDAPNIYFPICF